MSRGPSTTGRALPALLAVVAVGGALGAVGRWAAVALTPAETGFPWTTFAINVTGSFALAVLPAALTGLRPRRHALATAFLGPGLLGGWTTLSAYAEQARSLVDRGSVGLAAAYVVGTLVACLVAVALGRRLVGPVGGPVVGPGATSDGSDG